MVCGTALDSCNYVVLSLLVCLLLGDIVIFLNNTCCIKFDIFPYGIKQLLLGLISREPGYALKLCDNLGMLLLYLLCFAV